jgi:hypothetical protein
LAINFNSRRVFVVEGPDIELFDQVLEVGASLIMETLIFLDGVDWHLEQVWLSYDVPLKVEEVGMLPLSVPVNSIHCHSDFFAIVFQIPWSDRTVLRSLNLVRHAPWEDKVEIWELLSCSNDSSHFFSLVK